MRTMIPSFETLLFGVSEIYGEKKRVNSSLKKNGGMSVVKGVLYSVQLFEQPKLKSVKLFDQPRLNNNSSSVSQN